MKINTGVLILITILTISCLIECQNIISSGKVQTDRWMEIDLSYFNPDSITTSTARFWKRIAPLYEGIAGTKGIIINCGWVPEWVRDWRGDMEDTVYLPLDMTHEPILGKAQKLTGTWVQQIEQWKKRYANAGDRKPRYTRNWTYNQIKMLIDAIRCEAKIQSDIDSLKIGTLMVGWDWHKPFFLRHPEIAIDFPYVKNFFNIRARLKADTIKYAAFPNGIPEGTLWVDFFAAQWGEITKKLGFDAILLRDNIFSVGDNRRMGPWGRTNSADTSFVREYSDACSYFLKALKKYSPNCFIIGYSAPAGAVASPRVFNFDLERIAHEGNLDAWIDQTWAGAWNEVGVRMSNFWNQPYLGYTNQVANVLINGAILADTKVKHYVITGVWDTWESWDAIHTVPEKLRWEQWSYWHAAVKKPGGLKLIDGNYIAHIINQKGEMLSEEDVNLINQILNNAIENARQMDDVLGPTLVYNSKAIAYLNSNQPDIEISEWIDNQAGIVSKWGLPIGSSTRIEYLPFVNSDLFIFQTPSYIDSITKENIIKLIKSGKALSVWGSPDRGVDPDIKRMIGIIDSKTINREPATCAMLSDELDFLQSSVPKEFGIYHYVNCLTTVADEVKVIYTIKESPALFLNQTDGNNISFWDPADYQQEESYGDLDVPFSERLGSVFPYLLVSRVLNYQLKLSGKFNAKHVEAFQPVACMIWKMKNGKLNVMCGNLEEGIYNSSDYSVTVTFQLPSTYKSMKIIKEIWRQEEALDSVLIVSLKEAESKLFLIE